MGETNKLRPHVVRSHVGRSSLGYRWAEPALPREHDLPHFDGQVHFPDYRIEYEADGRERHEGIELFTPHYRGAHAVGRAKTGFRIYVVGSRGGGGRSAPHPRVMDEFL
jgi:hypothetical protein